MAFDLTVTLRHRRKRGEKHAEKSNLQDMAAGEIDKASRKLNMQASAFDGALVNMAKCLRIQREKSEHPSERMPY